MRLKVLLYLCMMVILVPMVGFLVQAPTFFRLVSYSPPLSTEVYDRNGVLLYRIFKDENRVWVPLDAISDSLEKATIAAEDRRFYAHPGVDPIAVLRAGKATLFDRDLQGGSTLTQQYVKNAVLDQRRTVDRKFEEVLLAAGLEAINTKSEILEKYLNQVSYGKNLYGVETAAYYYFGKRAADITLSEAAYLAAIPQQPSAKPDELLLKQQKILSLMKEYGFISDQDYLEAKDTSLVLRYLDNPFLAPHFVTEVKKNLVEQFGTERVETGGLKVTTTLDYTVQETVAQIVTQEINGLTQYRVNNGAAVVLSPRTGEVLAMVGSRDYFNTTIGGQYNVITAKRQPGSTFKPFVYATAFEHGYSPATVLLDVPTRFPDTNGSYIPQNYDNSFHGPVSIRKALGNSYNIPATRMTAAMGVNTLVHTAEKVGFTYIDSRNVGVSLALGGAEVRPIDLASAYTAFADYGVIHPAQTLLSVYDSHGTPVYTNNFQNSHQVFSKKTAYLIADILADNSARSQTFGSTSKLAIKGAKVAVKTGTTNKKADNWAVGFNRKFLVTVWVGNNDNTPMGAVASGVTGATPIWRKITDFMLEKYGNEWLTKPDGITDEDTNPHAKELLCENGDLESLPNPCGSENHTLVENRDGTDVVIKDLTPEEYASFTTDPMQFIQENKDILQADERPTPIFVRTGHKIQDPLSKIHPEFTMTLPASSSGSLLSANFR